GPKATRVGRIRMRGFKHQGRPGPGHYQLRRSSRAANGNRTGVLQSDDDRPRDTVGATREFDETVPVAESVLNGLAVIALAVPGSAELADVAHGGVFEMGISG